MRLVKADDGLVVCGRCVVADSFWKRLKGLLGRKELPSGEGLLIVPTNSIHMFFMRFAIDAVFVNADGRVTKVVPDLKPWRVVWWAPGARDCLELAAGTAARTGTRPGDELRLVDDT
jgi:uncharacterized protein